MLPRGVEDLARVELEAAGAADLRATSGGIACRGSLATAYHTCLWSRVGSRLLLALERVDARSSAAFHAGVAALNWEDHLGRGATIAVEARVRGDRALNTHFVAQRTKDAIVDRLRARQGWRPDVDLDDPDVRVHVLVDGDKAQLSLDLSGEPLHRRGYRGATGAAPLKENVAAALLLRSDWPAIAARGGGLLDPMCGTGTILAEAALIAGDVAPGLLRDRYGFHGWRGHDERLWRSIVDEAQARAGTRRLPPLAGADRDRNALDHAQDALVAAGVDDRVTLRRADVGDSVPPGETPGLVATNAPYGHRIGGFDLPAVYRRLGEAMKARFAGWMLALLTADAELAGEVRMRAFRRNALYNGALRCELLQYRVGETPGLSRRPAEPGREGP